MASGNTNLYDLQEIQFDNGYENTVHPSSINNI